MKDFEKSYIVNYFDLDKSGRLKPNKLLEYMTDMAVLGAMYHKIEAKKDHAFILHKNNISFDFSKDLFSKNLKIRSFYRTNKDIYVNRYYIFYVDNEFLGYGITQWVLMNLKDRTLSRIDNDLVEMFKNFQKNEDSYLDEKNYLEDKNKVLEIKKYKRQKNLGLNKLTTTSCKLCKSKSYTSFFDLDRNQHINNSVYLKWALDSVESDFIINHEIEKIYITYKQERFHGNEPTQVFSTIETQDEKYNLHSELYEDSKELAILDIVFK